MQDANGSTPPRMESALNFRGRMQNSIIRVLVVDDYEKWRSFARATIEKQDGLEVIGEISDGLQALQQAQQLQPELIIVDIGIPTINGIEVARRIRESTSKAKILFLTENRSPEIAEKALSTGANGYVVKSDAGRELLPAIKAVLEGKRFISKSLAGHFLVTAPLSIAQVSLLISVLGWRQRRTADLIMRASAAIPPHAEIPSSLESAH